jgi:hypothetical protein
MRKAIIFAMFAVVLGTGSALADVKIKTRQTMSGQSYENTIYIKGKRQRTESMGGAMVSITQCDLSRDIQLDPSSKAYTVSIYDEGSVGQASPTTQKTVSTEATKGGTMYITTTIKDTGERKQMFGYTARHIIQTVETESSPDACYPTKSKMEMDMWVIDAEFALLCDQNREFRSYKGGNTGGCRDKIVPKTIGSAKSGYPVYQKMTTFDADGKENYSMIQEVIEISKANLDIALFEIPADYREVSDSAQLYSAGIGANGTSYGSKSANNIDYSGAAANRNPSLPSAVGLGASLSRAAEPPSGLTETGTAKKPGTVRIGVPRVKTGAVGTGISAPDLGLAIRNTLGEYLDGTNVEFVPLEARLASAWAEEAKQKECDYVVIANVSHKKGGGGFGGFGKVMGAVAPIIPMAGGTAGVVEGQVISTAISVSSMSGSMKSKDEITLDITLKSLTDNSVVLTKQYKAKAKSDGDDIISAVIEPAAQAILDIIGK